MELMRPILVYRIQENAYGLSAPRRKGRIQDLASDANRRRFKMGTKIIREWKGQLHEVAVTAKGMCTTVRCTRAFRQSRFASLVRNGQGQPSSARSLERAIDARTSVEGKMRDLHT